ncbi:MAG: hypothetical protein B6I35_11240 [Anaerolineaceae bacterium 4572_32.2]|nr:MAG: hypothetical protein B6I35_11240 [Anaerolineaceae bacterium 4572_32.2]
MNGYIGKILHVDLSTGELWDEPLNEKYARAFVGGSGLAARYLYDMVDADTDPLGPDNALIFMTGPLVGTRMPSAGRCSVCALSPLTRIWGESNTGGFFGPSALPVTTASSSPDGPRNRSGSLSWKGRPNCATWQACGAVTLTRPRNGCARRWASQRPASPASARPARTKS